MMVYDMNRMFAISMTVPWDPVHVLYIEDKRHPWIRRRGWCLSVIAPHTAPAVMFQRRLTLKQPLIRPSLRAAGTEIGDGLINALDVINIGTMETRRMEPCSPFPGFLNFLELDSDLRMHLRLQGSFAHLTSLTLNLRLNLVKRA